MQLCQLVERLVRTTAKTQGQASLCDGRCEENGNKRCECSLKQKARKSVAGITYNKEAPFEAIFVEDTKKKDRPVVPIGPNGVKYLTVEVKKQREILPNGKHLGYMEIYNALETYLYFCDDFILISTILERISEEEAEDAVVVPSQASIGDVPAQASIGGGVSSTVLAAI